jgi:hypothetical protein
MNLTSDFQNATTPELVVCVLSSELPLDGSSQDVSIGLLGGGNVLLQKSPACGA